jgi:hypothetical protein
VKIVCGQETRLLSAEEPAKCEYAMVLATPAACQAAALGHDHDFAAAVSAPLFE